MGCMGRLYICSSTVYGGRARRRAHSSLEKKCGRWQRKKVGEGKKRRKKTGGGGEREKYLMANSLSLYTYMKDGSSNQVEMADRERRKMASRPMARRPDLLVALTDGLFFRCSSFSSSSGFIFPTIIKLKSLRLGPSWGGPLRYYLVPRW